MPRAIHQRPKLTRTEAPLLLLPLSAPMVAESSISGGGGGRGGGVEVGEELLRLARKQMKRLGRVEFARGVQAERGIQKTAQKEKRRSKHARKGQEGVKQTNDASKGAARRRARYGVCTIRC